MLPLEVNKKFVLIDIKGQIYNDPVLKAILNGY